MEPGHTDLDTRRTPRTRSSATKSTDPDPNTLPQRHTHKRLHSIPTQGIPETPNRPTSPPEPPPSTTRPASKRVRTNPPQDPTTRSLDNYEVSPPPEPPIPPTANNNNTSENARSADATNTLLARIQANAAKAKDQPSQPTPTLVSPANPAYTPHPDNGFPVVHGRNSTFIFDNMDYDQQVAWLTLPDPHVFIQPLHHGYYPPEIAQEIVGLIKETIETIFDCPAVKVTAPIATSPPHSLDRAPFTYLIRNIPSSVVDSLLKQRCWATQKIAFIVHSPDPQVPSYLGGIQGLNVDTDDLPNIPQLVTAAFSQEHIHTILAEISESNPTLSGFSPEERAKQVIQTLQIDLLHIRSSGGPLRPIVNLYMTSPSDKDDDWSRLLQAVASMTYKHAFMGSGTYYPGWLCSICHSIDHPAGLCKFPHTPGWINATPIPPLLRYRTQHEYSAVPAQGTMSGRRGGMNNRGRSATARGMPASRRYDQTN